MSNFQRIIFMTAAVLIALRLFFPVQWCLRYELGGPTGPGQFPPRICIDNELDYRATALQIAGGLVLAVAVGLLLPLRKKE